MEANDCIFCKIARGEIPATVVYQDEQVMAFRDLNPSAPTHILIIPKVHITNLNDVDESNSALIGALIATAPKIAKSEGVGESGYRLISNVGVEGGQSVYHLHFHLLGGRKLLWPPG